MSGRCSLASRRIASLVPATLALLMPLSSRAQGTTVGVISDQRKPDSAQLAAATELSVRMQSPATLALMMKQELALSPTQVKAIEARARLEVDSGRARRARLVAGAQQAAVTKTGAIAAGRGWTGPIDEAGIRAEMCERSRAQADMVIATMRERRALGALLTTAQQHQFDLLQRQAGLRMMRESMHE